jgi:hypothetical protein
MGAVVDLGNTVPVRERSRRTAAWRSACEWEVRALALTGRRDRDDSIDASGIECSERKPGPPTPKTLDWLFWGRLNVGSALCSTMRAEGGQVSSAQS